MYFFFIFLGQLDEEIQEFLLVDNADADDQPLDFEFEHYIYILKNTWSGYGKNSESIAELWINLLQFYGVKMLSERLVINILTKRAMVDTKQFSGDKPRLIIEEPFNITWDMAGHVSYEMFSYIKHIFCNAISLFTCKIERQCSSENLQDSHIDLFDPELLCDTPRPTRAVKKRKSSNMKKNIEQ